MRVALPISDGPAVRRYAVSIARRHPRMLWGALALHTGAALAALAAPRLLGDLVQSVERGTTEAVVDRIVLLLAGFLGRPDRAHPLRPVPEPGARRAGARRAARGLRGQRPRAAGRCRRIRRVGRPADPHQPRRRPARLVGPSRAPGVDDRGRVRGPHVRSGGERRLVGGAALPARRPATGDRPALVPRPGQGRLPARVRDVLQINATLTETVEGARTVESLNLGEERIEQIDRDISDSYDAERYTLYLRTVFFPSMEIAYLIPTVTTLLFGGYLYTQGQASLGDVAAATLYVQMLIDPVDRIVSILDELQVGAASLARLLGVAQVPDDREVSGARPDGEQIAADDVRFSYVDGRDVLHGVDLDVGVGERIAMVGPSGAGKSTLGRLLAASTAADRRRDRRWRGPGGAPAVRPARPRRAGHPGAPRLRRQRA